MPSAVHEQTADAVNLNNIKSIGELHALTAGLSGQNQLSLQQRVNEIATSNFQNALTSAQQLTQLAGQQALQISADAAALRMAMLGRTTRHVLDMSAEQAAAFEKTLGAQLQDSITELNSALASTQQGAKIAMTTPPETGIASALSTLAAGQAAIIEMLRGARPAP